VGKNKPFLIVGQGLAGTILAHHFLAAKIPFEIWDAPNFLFKSSHAAGGIYNPVTGRKLEKTWLAEELFTYLPEFYRQLEQTLQASFFHPMPLFRPFANAEMRSWLADRKTQIDHDYLENEAEICCCGIETGILLLLAYTFNSGNTEKCLLLMS
jgi:hypothetical protein